VTSGQLVGMGTTSPATVLDVATSNSGITLTNTAVSNKQWRLGGSSAGSFVITETGVADRLTINTSGYVGIGTNTPDALLHVNTASGKVATFGNIVNNNGNYVVIAGSVGNKNWVVSANMIVGGEFGIGLTSTVGGTTIGSSHSFSITPAGYVTTPYQPAFQVYGTNLTGTTYLGGTTALNVGSFFNTSTGIFTAPVAGNYLFSFSLSTSDTNSQFINIAKNGTLYASNMLQYGIAFITGGQSLIIPLAANDTVNAAVRDASYAIYNARFCGYLLG
jgi:hypothetical protein